MGARHGEAAKGPQVRRSTDHPRHIRRWCNRNNASVRKVKKLLQTFVLSVNPIVCKTCQWIYLSSLKNSFAAVALDPLPELPLFSSIPNARPPQEGLAGVCALEPSAKPIFQPDGAGVRTRASPRTQDRRSRARERR